MQSLKFILKYVEYVNIWKHLGLKQFKIEHFLKLFSDHENNNKILSHHGGPAILMVKIYAYSNLFTPTILKKL